jgi:hypothetical protein
MWRTLRRQNWWRRAWRQEKMRTRPLVGACTQLLIPLLAVCQVWWGRTWCKETAKLQTRPAPGH